MEEKIELSEEIENKIEKLVQAKILGSFECLLKQKERRDDFEGVEN